MSAQTDASLNTSLSSLAMLSIRMGQGNDYLDYLRGFVIEALHHIHTATFDAGQVHLVIKSEFGLRIPSATLAIYLKRLQKSKIIEPTSDGYQFRIVDLPKSSIAEDRSAARGRINEVLEVLKKHSFSEYGRQWTEDQTAAALTEFIRKYSIEFVRHSELRSPLPDPGTDSASDHFIVASFVRRCAEEAHGIFESVKTLVESHILANALLCPDLKDKGTGFKNVVFVLDTRLLLKVFDLESPIDTENTRTLLESVRRLKGVHCVFPETKEEILSVLNGIKRGFEQGGARGPVVEELRKRGRGLADVILAESRLEENLRQLGISTLQSPHYDAATYRFQIDEVALRNELEEELGYPLGRAADHDVHAVRSIFALRRGRQISRIEDAGYVFLTTNTALSRAAYTQQRAESDGWVFSAVITDFHLSHLVWLKSPMTAGDLSRTELLSSCYAAMRPPQAMWRKYLAEVDRLRGEGRFTEQDHEVLRLSLKAPEELMHVTRGEAEGISENNIRKILEKLEMSYAAEARAQAELAKKEADLTKAALADARASALQNAAELDKAAAREDALKKENQSRDEQVRKLQQAEAEARSREQKRKERIARLAKRTASVAYVFAWIVFAVTTGLCFLANKWWGIPAAVFGVFNIAAGFSGTSIRKFVHRKIEGALSAMLE